MSAKSGLRESEILDLSEKYDGYICARLKIVCLKSSDLRNY